MDSSIALFRENNVWILFSMKVPDGYDNIIVGKLIDESSSFKKRLQKPDSVTVVDQLFNEWMKLFYCNLIHFTCLLAMSESCELMDLYHIQKSLPESVIKRSNW